MTLRLSGAGWLIDWLVRNDPFDVERVEPISGSTIAVMVKEGHLAATAAGVQKLCERSHMLLSRHPREALVIARVGVSLATRVVDDVAVVVETTGDAWKHLAAALRELSEHREALAAAHSALEAYAMLETEVSLHKMAAVDLIKAQSLYAVGQPFEALSLIERATHFILAFSQDRKQYVKARIIYAYMFMELGRFEDALGVLKGSAEIAQLDDDTEMLAYILNNVGLCYVHLGRLAEARPCFDTALEIFDALGMKAEVENVRSALAVSLIEAGRYNEAISEMYIRRNNYLQMGMPVVAAEISLHIVELLFLANRVGDVPSLSSEMIKAFRRVGLHREAVKALGYVNRLAQRHRLNRDRVAAARRFLERLQESPSALFGAG